MSTSDEVGGAFEEGSEADYEVFTSDEPVVEEKEEPDGVQLTKEQYDELLKGKDSVGAMSQSFKDLAESLKPRGPVNVQAPIRDDYDPVKLEEDLWKPGKAAEVITRVAQRVAGQQTGQMAIAAQDMEKRLLKMDPDTSEIFRKYEKEIEEKVEGLPVQYKYQPNVYGQVYRMIVQEKQEEIINFRAGKMAEEIAKKAVEEALSAAGIRTPKGPSMQVETGGGAAARPKQRLVITSADREDMLESMMDPKDPEQVQAYLRWKKGKGL